MANTLFYIIIFFLVLNYLIERILDHLNKQNWSSQLPTPLKGIYDEKKYKKSQEYDKVKQKLSFWSSSFNLLLILGLLISCGFAIVDDYVRTITENPIWMALIFFGILFFASDIINIPFSIYGIFKIEENFGFNKTTPKIFILDKAKAYLLAIILGGGLLALFVWFYIWAGSNFWMYVWGAYLLVSLLFMAFYTNLIVPIFNKLTPLPQGELRTTIEQYCRKVNFSLKNLYVIDSSKRSTKSNAYFSGIGSKKSIVLFDTLIEKHTIEELVAILSHEIGHYKKKHTLKFFVISSIQMLIMLFILSWLIDNPVLAKALGAKTNSFHLGLLAFSLLYTPISMITSILMNILSRKYEYQADKFAKDTYNPVSFKNALKKLSIDNLSNLNPHPAYVFIHYSHPPLLKRLAALDKK